ncbi:MAG TPA: CDP-2,3-bis-(O-geranylgeranyl)-sn-glycerol synthase [Methanomassiliicoccales archaeon]|nr:CDP-2,3-bis-(O-geranylgeranyl)-sn-glycerol synthase [Methanomassiliicoccales archaeon]
MDALQSIAVGIWVFLPALVPNSAAVLFGGGAPIDKGRTWKGKRVLGDGKTWRGLIGGVLSGVLVGYVQLLMTTPSDGGDYLGYGPMPQAAGIIVVLALGSLLGDMGGAFVKRRMGLARGEKATGLDQYDFVVGALILAAVIFPSWFLSIYVEGNGWMALIALIVIVPVIHRLVNVIGYRRGLKKEPW